MKSQIYLLRNRRGAAAVEFAVILPVLVLLLLGGVEVGRAVMVQHALQEAAQAGCRIYTVKDKAESDVEQMVAKAMSGASIAGYKINFEPATKKEIDKHMEPVTVTVSVGYQDIAWSKPWFMSGATLVGRCTMPADLEEVGAASSTPSDPPDAGGGDSDDDDRRRRRRR